MPTEQAKKAETRPTLREAVAEAVAPLTKNGKGKEIAQISRDMETVETAPVAVLVCGEFKRGKSTFVNAIIGRNVCATDTDICTSVVSVIKYGDKEKVTRHFGDFSDIKSEEISLDSLEHYTVGTAEQIGNTLFVEIALPLPALKAGLVLIDTPGVGGLDPRHAALTKFFLPKADITLMMADVNEPMTTTELNFLRDNVLPYAPQSALVVNKADMSDAAGVADMVADAVNKIATHTQTPKERIKAVAVSSVAEAYPDQDRGESNFGELRKMMAEMVDTHRNTHRKILRDNLVELLNLTIAPIAAELMAIEQPDVHVLDEMVARKKVIDKKLAELSDKASPFHLAVGNAVTAKREEVVNYVNECSVALHEQFTALLKTDEARTDEGGKWLGICLNDILAEMGASVNNQLGAAFAEIASMPQFEGMLNFEAREFSGHISVREVDTSVPINKRLTPMLSGAGIASLGAFYLATGPIGVLASLAVGAYVACRNSFDASKGHIEQQLRQAYQPDLQSAISRLNTHVASRFTEFQQEWLRVVLERAKAYQESTAQAIDAIKKLKGDINAAVSKRVQVQNRLMPLTAAKEKVLVATI